MANLHACITVTDKLRYFQTREMFSEKNFNISILDCSQPSIFSYFYSIVERADRIARELDASEKRETWRGRGWGPRKIERKKINSIERSRVMANKYNFVTRIVTFWIVRTPLNYLVLRMRTKEAGETALFFWSFKTMYTNENFSKSTH